MGATRLPREERILEMGLGDCLLKNAEKGKAFRESGERYLGAERLSTVLSRNGFGRTGKGIDGLLLFPEKMRPGHGSKKVLPGVLRGSYVFKDDGYFSSKKGLTWGLLFEKKGGGCFKRGEGDPGTAGV